MRFEPEQLLRALNKGRDVRTVAFSLKAKAQRTGAAMAGDSAYDNAAGTFQAHLRKLVDEWVLSGRYDGLDRPMRRTLRPGHGAFMEMVDYVQRNHPLPRVLASGEIYFDFSHPISNERQPDGPHDPIEEMQQEAVAEFVRLMRSPLKYKIAKCGWCPNYFFRKKLRPSYKADRMFCPQCRNGATARSRTEKKRTDEHAKLVRYAAEALRGWRLLSNSTRSKYGTEAKYVGSKLQKHGKTAKWYARNEKEVAERL